MPAVVVQLGQCGNQVGVKFFSAVISDASRFTTSLSLADNEEYYSEVANRFFYEESLPGGGTALRPRAVMVDMEPKVVAQAVAESKRSGQWCYSATQQFVQKRGSGNNWAYGYCVHGPKAEQAIMDTVQREVEKCDRFDGFVPVMSLAGGTGSGVGTYVTECLRSEYPKSFILNEVVWPHAAGEVIVQNYNALLTLSRLYASSDAILVLENDRLHDMCSRLLNVKVVSFDDINMLIARKMASIFQPATRSDTSQPTSGTYNFLGDYLEQLVSQPDYKLLRLLSIPLVPPKSVTYSSFLWAGLLKHLRQMLVSGASMEEGIDWQVKVGGHLSFNRSIANLLVLRGGGAGSVDMSSFQNNTKLYASWVAPASAFAGWHNRRPLSGHDKCAAVLSNSQAVQAPLDAIVQRAWDMFSSHAYVHQYTQHGLETEDFVDSFASVERVLQDYERVAS